MNGEESPPKLSRRRAIGYGEFCTPIRMPRPGAWGASLSGHPLFQSREAFLGGLLNEGHIFSKVLLGVNFAFLAPFLLVQSELRDHGAVFLVQRFPDRLTFSLYDNGVLVAGWIGRPCGAPARSQ